MRVRFWGTRGSVPTPGATTVRYGGNTSCVEVRAADGTLVVLDCGTGAIALGRALLTENTGPIRGTLLIGHTHWDHIQGFPFFAPLFVPGHHWEVYGPGGFGRQLERGLTGQMVYEHFPVSLQDLLAQVRIQHLTEGSFEVGSIRVTTQYLNHPVFTLGYRLEGDGVTLVYATDFEPFSLYPLKAPAGTMPLHPEDQRHIQFLAGADLVIHDAQYTLDDFPTKTGWGHMPMERAVDCALLAQARRLVLFHHDPLRHDAAVEQLHERAQARAEAGGTGLQVDAAAEGQVIELSHSPSRSPLARSPEVSALRRHPSLRASTVLLAGAPTMVRLLEPALHAEGLHILTASDAEAALQLARQAEPALILLDLALPKRGGLVICRTLREETEPALRDVPIVLLMGRKYTERELRKAFAAGVTDCLTPVKPTLVRSRVCAWLLRNSVTSHSAE
jgi:phosphoribosyl 1,2-cyclic phosphodiesterase/CheY-like chemotaxis protein